MTPQRVLIVDGKALCYTAYYSLGHTETRTSEGTEIIFGFFSKLLQLCDRTKSAHIIFCWDSRKSLRKLECPEYKSGRKDNTNLEMESFFEQVDFLQKECIDRLGFINNFMAIGYEADDLIATLCKFPGPTYDQEYFIASEDHDLYQLLTERVSMIKLRKPVLYRERDFEKEFGIPSHLWSEVKSLAGCNSDNVKGIPLIGPKRAIEFLLGKENPRITSEEGQEIVRRNRSLVTLPYKDTPKLKLDWETKPSFEEWEKFCQEFDFFPFIDHSSSWRKIFNGQSLAVHTDMIKIRRREHA